MTWQPMTEQHAIERVRIVMLLDQAVPLKKARLLGNGLEQRREELGFEPLTVQSGQSIVLQVGPNGPSLVPHPQEASNWIFQRLSAEGQPIEALHLNQATLVYENIEYARWAVFLERFVHVAGEVVRDILGSHDVAALALEYQDQFWFDGPPASALPNQFLEVVTGTMPTAVTDSGEPWHLHRGWFETGEHGRLLVAQNLDALDEVVPINGGVETKTLRVVRITTRAEARKGFWTIAGEELQPHLEIMHKRTNQVFADSLTDEMRRRVGISSENA